MAKERFGREATRRGFLKASAGAALAGSIFMSGIGPARAQTRPLPAPATATGTARNGLNILFVFTDQERYHARWPHGLSLPGHERLERSGVTFTNHQCPGDDVHLVAFGDCYRAPDSDNGMFENLDVPWMRDLSTKHPTIGHMLRKAGYYTAYKGKWHLSREFDTRSVEQFMTPHMEKYGFADNFSPGDLIGHTLGGYSYDHITAGSAINWLRTKGRPLSDDAKPWCMFMSFVNPHDIMYFNTDAPGERVQDNGRLRLHAARAPEHALYKATWDVPVPASLRQPLDAPGAARRASRVRPDLGLHPGQRAARGRALEALQRLLHQLHPKCGPAARGRAGRARRARPVGSHDRGLHRRPWRDGGQPQPARQGAVRLRRVQPSAASPSCIPT